MTTNHSAIAAIRTQPCTIQGCVTDHIDTNLNLNLIHCRHTITTARHNHRTTTNTDIVTTRYRCHCHKPHCYRLSPPPGRYPNWQRVLGALLSRAWNCTGWRDATSRDDRWQ
jgi:hypothetical protein